MTLPRPTRKDAATLMGVDARKRFKDVMSVSIRDPKFVREAMRICARKCNTRACLRPVIINRKVEANEWKMMSTEGKCKLSPEQVVQRFRMESDTGTFLTWS